MKKIDSLLNYIGHKSKVIEQILPHLPERVEGTFYDAFAGSCVVGLNVPYESILCVEKNPHLSDLYTWIDQEWFEQLLFDLIKEYDLTNSSVTPRSEYLKDPRIGTVTWMGEKIPNLHLDQLNKPGYDRLIQDFNSGKWDHSRKAAAYMIATIYGRNSSVTTNADGTLSGSVGPLDYSKRCAQKLREHREVLNENRHMFMNRSYQWIEPEPDDFVYLDPPYLASSYRYGGWTEDDERELLAWIEQLPCPWALSNTFQSGNKQNTILIDWAKDKQVIELNKRYRIWATKEETAKRKPKINREVLVLPKPL